MRRSGGGFAALNTRSNPHRRGSDNGFFNGIRPLRALIGAISSDRNAEKAVICGRRVELRAGPTYQDHSSAARNLLTYLNTSQLSSYFSTNSASMNPKAFQVGGWRK
jgi:hypothetical protein